MGETKVGPLSRYQHILRCVSCQGPELLAGLIAISPPCPPLYAHLQVLHYLCLQQHALSSTVRDRAAGSAGTGNTGRGKGIGMGRMDSNQRAHGEWAGREAQAGDLAISRGGRPPGTLWSGLEPAPLDTMIHVCTLNSHVEGLL